MRRSRIRLVSLVRKLLKRYLVEHPEHALPLSFAESIEEIVLLVETNFRSKRFASFNKKERGSKSVTQAAYLERVISVWIIERQRWLAIKNHDPIVWNSLKETLCLGAKAALRRLGHQRLDSAEDYGNRAAERILKGRFTFDIPLDIWIATILKNEILDRPARKDLLHYSNISLSELVANEFSQATLMERQLADDHAHQFETQLADHDVLDKYLGRLAPMRANVIRGTYLDGLSPAQLAVQLGKTPSQIHTLHHRALRDLRALLERDSVSETRSQTHQNKGKQIKRAPLSRKSKRAGRVDKENRDNHK